MKTMAGPRRTIDLDKEPTQKVGMNRGSVYLYQGKAWEFDPVGCALCAEPADSQSSTIKHVNAAGAEEYVCQRHGALEEIPHKVIATIEVVAGGSQRVFQCEKEASFLLPLSLPAEERNRLIQLMIEMTVNDERKLFSEEKTVEDED